ncbi:hypothetical protein OWR29_41655 [Actinoplanes sp. Pm04-4]|uniref:Uncharacterized protein n=1 Tax=Paractinoplanes pyxinae TaxID=2997416 RepID=A0ABT4BDF6_9ACTN|nr:hypothetical protein [Actinoplanes pyxinae]MCY1144544.1 hypothetical protein [Actinoplanes pyxinae]
MKHSDEDLVAVRDLPPGVTEPSDEALARVRQRVFAQPAPRRLAWPLTVRRFWVPIAAAAAVLLVVGVGLAYLRPRAIGQPHPVSSDPATVRRVFDKLIAAAGNATPYRPRAGQLVYQDDRLVELDALDGRPFEYHIVNWIEPASTTYVGSTRLGPGAPASTPPGVWASENAKDRFRSTPLSERPLLELTDFLDGPADPVAARRELIDLIRTDTAVPEDDQVWGAIYEMAVLDALIPVERRKALYQVLAGLPVGVGETGVDGRRLVIVRFATPAGGFVGSLGEDKVYDLLIDPVTGTIAGTQVLLADPAAAETPARVAVELTGPSVSGSTPALVPLAPGAVDPALVRRDLYSFGLVEDIGQRP